MARKRNACLLIGGLMLAGNWIVDWLSPVVGHAEHHEPPVPVIVLTLLTVANLVAAWQAAGLLRGWWLAAGLAALADRTFTFAFFIPTMIRLLGAPPSPESAAIATRWWNLNYLRLAIVENAQRLRQAVREIGRCTRGDAAKAS